MNRVLVMLLFGAALAGAEKSGSWETLERVRSGDSIRVETRNMGVKSGRFVAYTPNSISLRGKNQTTEISREEVLTVKRKSGAIRGRNTLIGFGVGAAVAGTVAGLTVNQGDVAYMAMAGAGLTVVGTTLVGALLPAYETIYVHAGR